jgi:8-oxo-dGTP pyrophosphatase MutT (NUDIX family)
MDEEEDPRAAAFRELREETGVTSAEYLGEVRVSKKIFQPLKANKYFT